MNILFVQVQINENVMILFDKIGKNIEREMILADCRLEALRYITFVVRIINLLLISKQKQKLRTFLVRRLIGPAFHVYSNMGITNSNYANSDTSWIAYCVVRVNL